MVTNIVCFSIIKSGPKKNSSLDPALYEPPWTINNTAIFSSGLASATMIEKLFNQIISSHHFSWKIFNNYRVQKCSMTNNLHSLDTHNKRISIFLGIYCRILMHREFAVSMDQLVPEPINNMKNLIYTFEKTMFRKYNYLLWISARP